MSSIHIQRDHRLGLAKARSIARKWARDAQERLAMQCTIERGGDADVVHFSRAGVRGQLLVAADRFELNATLGLLLSVFRRSFESEIEKQLDKLLEDGQGSPRKKEKAAAPGKKAAARRK